MWYYAILLLFCPHIIEASYRTCNAKFCDPNWTPYDNMEYALRGYNIKSGNPIHNQGDPGFMGQIFLPTKLNDDGRIELETGITASELSYCKRTLISKSFTTITGYRNYVSESSSSGVNLQLGTETEVTAGVNLKGVDLSAKKVIPKPFERAWGDSRDFKQLTRFFSEKHGLLTVTLGTCIMYEMKLDRFHLPAFTDPFKKALIKLFDYRSSPEHKQKSLFRTFISEYGTHFLLRTKMGAEYVYRSKFSKSAREQFNTETLKTCSYVNGAKVFGVQVEEDKSGCKTTDLQKLNNLRTEDYESTIITKGSRPTDIEKWATQDFTPVPLKFQLSPIVNLMSDQYINKTALQTSKGEAVTSLEIRKWFLPLYFDYCDSMNVDCGHKEGCGIDDKCPVDAICVPGGNKHECTQWGPWTCTVTCGQGTQKRRTRQCTGCKGQLEQIANKRCAPQIECYKHIPICLTKHTPWNHGSSDVHYLDRHLVDCGDQYILNRFHLVRSGPNYRYTYQCCQAQLRCHSNNWRNSAVSYVNSGNFLYLDRQAVDCPHHSILSGFVQRRYNGDHLYYSYRCCELPQLRHCYLHWTHYSSDGGGNTVYLDRQHPSCHPGYGISYFQLTRTGGHIRYLLKCCKITSNGTKRDADQLKESFIQSVMDEIGLKKK